MIIQNNKLNNINKFSSSNPHEKLNFIYYEFIIITAVIFLLNVIIKYYFITTNAMFQDDLVGLPYAINGVLVSTKSSLYLYLAHFLGSVIKIKLFIIFILSITAGATYIFIKDFFVNYLYAFSVTILSFAGISTAEIGNHVMGSFMIWSYLVFIIFCNFIKYTKDNNRFLIPLFFSVTFGILYYFFQSPYALILTFPTIIFFYYNKNYHVNYKYYIYYFLFNLPIALSILHSHIYSIDLHHYQSMGWISYRSDIIINNIIKYFKILYEYIVFIFIYKYKSVSFYYQSFFLTFLIGLTFLVFNQKKFSIPKRLYINRIFVGIGIFCLFVCALIPVLPLQRTIADRYLFLPTIFIWILLFYLIDTIANYIKYPFIKNVIFTLSLLLIVITVNSAIAIQDKNYSPSAITQKKIDEFINKTKYDWPQNSQIVIVLDTMPPNFTMGYNHWSTGFIQYVSGRKDLTGIIGIKPWLIDMPFVDNFNLHGREYWAVSNRKDGTTVQTRKRMVGLVENRPTFAYFLNLKSNEARKFNYICFKNKSGESLYAIDKDGFKFKGRNFESSEMETLTYIINSDSNYTNKLSKRPPDEFSTFDGKSYKQKHLSITEFPSEISFEIMLKSNENSTCFNTSFVYDDHCPPMPLLAYPLAIYQDKHDRYRFQFKVIEDGKAIDKSLFFNFDPEQWYTFKFTFDTKNKTISIIVNDNPFEYIRNVEIDISKIKDIKLGQGYRQRFWNGKIAFFKVYDSEKRSFVDIQP